MAVERNLNIREALSGLYEAQSDANRIGELSLASAQLAIAMASKTDEAPDSLFSRLHDSPDTIDILEPKDFLTEDELKYLPAAQTVIGLVHRDASLRARRSAAAAARFAGRRAR